MSSRQHESEADLPCYAMVLPGLEDIAAEEIRKDLKADVKRTARGFVVFRPREADRDLLRLRTTEDVFLLAWGSDKLTYRAEDLERIRRWTDHDVDWNALLRIHHGIHPKPKGKPTYRLIVQMQGTHGYRRVDAREALAKGLAGKFPSSWKHAEENAAVEVWLTIDGATAICGLRLSDKTMRHRTYKTDHMPASLRPTVAAAMARVAEIHPGLTVLDPMCGAGTILAEVLMSIRRFGAAAGPVLGGDLEATPLVAAIGNLRKLGEPPLARWDARRLPLPAECVDRVVSNPPFGKQLSRPEDIGPLYAAMVREQNRVLRSKGRAVLLVSDVQALRQAARAVAWRRGREVRALVLGQMASICVFHKDDEA